MFANDCRKMPALPVDTRVPILKQEVVVRGEVIVKV
jgi:hypothetical protein